MVVHHVDNANLIGRDEKDVTSTLTELESQLDGTELMFREECAGEREMDSLGLLDGPASFSLHLGAGREPAPRASVSAASGGGYAVLETSVSAREVLT